MFGLNKQWTPPQPKPRQHPSLTKSSMQKAHFRPALGANALQ
jgi:hypothetical protein